MIALRDFTRPVGLSEAHGSNCHGSSTVDLIPVQRSDPNCVGDAPEDAVHRPSVPTNATSATTRLTGYLIGRFGFLDRFAVRRSARLTAAATADLLMPTLAAISFSDQPASRAA